MLTVSHSCDNCGHPIQDTDECLCRKCKPSLQVKADIAAKRAEIDAAYWTFTRSARGNPVPQRLYLELKTLEERRKK